MIPDERRAKRNNLLRHGSVTGKRMKDCTQRFEPGQGRQRLGKTALHSSPRPLREGKVKTCPPPPPCLGKAWKRQTVEINRKLGQRSVCHGMNVKMSWCFTGAAKNSVEKVKATATCLENEWTKLVVMNMKTNRACGGAKTVGMRTRVVVWRSRVQVPPQPVSHHQVAYNYPHVYITMTS